MISLNFFPNRRVRRSSSSVVGSSTAHLRRAGNSWRASLLAPAALLATFTLTLTAQSAVVLPFDTDFESAEGYSLGPITADAVWQIGSGLDAYIFSPGAGSSQALGFTGRDWLGLATDAGSPAAGVAWVDFYLKPVFASEAELPGSIVSTQSAVTGFITVDTQGEVYAVDGDGLGSGQWTASGFRTPLAADGESAFDWIRLSYRLDYSAKSWDLFIDGQLRLHDLGFLDNSSAALEDFALLGDSDYPTLLDYFYAGYANPLFNDTSGDGMPDDWLIAHGLNPNVHQRYDDPDLDGLANIHEYRLGTSPVLADSDGDGLDDGMELLLALDPLLADAPALGTVPFTDGFESDAPGTFASGTRQWSLTGGTVEVLAEVDAPAGNQYLKATDGETPTVLSRLFEDPQSHSEVWIDFQLKVGHRAEAPVELSAPRAASAFYFGPDGRLRALDGNGQGGGAWLALEHPPIPEGNWARLTVHHNYAAQTWSVWIDGGRRAESLGFRDTVPAFSQLQFDQLNALDDVSVAATEPAALDNDGDGLTNAEELALGTDPEATDTSGDGMSDGDKLAHGLDPLASDAFITSLQADGQGGYLWETEFTATEGFTSGDLHGQNHWNASAVGVTGSETAAFSDPMTSSSMERYFGSSGQTAIWLSFRARLTPGKLPEVITDGGQPLSLVFGASAGSFLSTYDANTAAWSDFSVDSDLAEWNDYTVHLDYATGRAMLLLNGGLVAVDLPFFNRDGMALTRIQLLRDALEAALDEPGADTEIDSITLATAEPADLDFSSDGMTNAEKRTLGLDPWLNDNSGDGFPDVWLVQYGFDPLTSFDPQSDTDGDGLSMADEYAFATDPTNPDTDGDGYLDGEEVIAGTDALEVSDSPDARGYLDWVLTDINQSSPAAAFTVDGKIALQAAGYGLHNTATDRLSLLHQTAQGDFTMTLRIHEFDNPHANAHISLTARRSTDSRSALVSFAARGDNRQRAYSLFSRPQDGGSWTRRNKNVVAFADPPNRYFRLSKSGDVWTASASRDGLAYEVIWEIIHEEPGPYELGVSLNGRGIHDTVRAVVSVEELLIDSDSDGLWDHEELALGTDPYSADTSADGISDYEKAHVFYLDPLASDTELQAVDANAISGADFHSSTGSWTRQNGEVYATDSVGSLFYDVDLAEPGTYRLIVEFTENNSLAPAAGGIFDLRADFAGLGLGTRRNTAAYGKTATVHFDLPHLSAGVHPLRLDWLNSTSGSFLRVREIRLVRFNGPDANENGEADWIENRLALTSQIDTLPQAIHVSPVNIEGASFAAQTVSAQAQPDDQPSESVDLEVHPGLSGRYFLDAPLDPEAATTVRIEDQNGLGQHELRLEWAAFNVVEHDAIDIRLDDSLLLMAEDTNASAQTVQLQLTAPDGTVEVHSLAPGARLQALFDHAGLWLASAELPDPDGDPGATIQFVTEIKVYAGSLNPAPIVFENRSRTWKPTLSSPDIELEADPGVSLIETDPGASLRRFQLAASRSGGNILARLPDAGPILGGTSVQAVVDRTRELLRDQIVETFADGTVMVRSAIQLGDVPDDLEIQINIFKSGVTFEDGTISRHLTAADFDETGRYQFFMLRSPGVRGGNCHRITYRQDGQVLSTL